MSKNAKRGRPRRQYRIRVRTERRDPIDYAKLAQAALEQAAMNQPRTNADGEASHQEPDQQDDAAADGDHP